MPKKLLKAAEIFQSKLPSLRDKKMATPKYPLKRGSNNNNNNNNQCFAFLHAVKIVLKDSLKFKCAVKQFYFKRHSKFLVIIQYAFNCFAKNVTYHLNAPKHEDPAPMSQKISSKNC